MGSIVIVDKVCLNKHKKIQLVPRVLDKVEKGNTLSVLGINDDDNSIQFQCLGIKREMIWFQVSIIT